MGIWDFISGTTDSIKRNAPDLTAVTNWCPKPDSLRRIAPDATAAKNLCSTVYGYGWASVAQIDSAVRGNLNHYLQDEEARSKTVQLFKNIAFYGAHESLKAVPGYKVMARSVRDLKEPDKQKVDVKAMEADLRELKKEFQEYRKLHGPEVDVKALRTEQVCVDKLCADLKSPNPTNINSDGIQTPEDVIRVFMMKEFMGKQFLDDVIIPQGTPRKK